MGKRSKIEMLPDNVLDELNHRLQNSRFSDYQQHSDWLHEQGYAIAKSTVHRHGQKLSKITSSKEEQALLDIFRQLAAADRHVLKRQVQMLLAVAEQEKKAAASAAREAG
jgi:predicted nucleotidyltransferase